MKTKNKKRKVKIEKDYLKSVLRAYLLYGAGFFEWMTKNIKWLLKEYAKREKEE